MEIQGDEDASLISLLISFKSKIKDGGTVGGLLIFMIAMFFLLLLLGLFLVLFYNRLIVARNMVQNAWAQIDVQLKRRADLIPNLVNTVKGYMEHERETLESVTRARTMALGAQNMEQRQEAENMLSGALKSLFAVAESYPQLQASQNFASLQNELSSTESKIAFSRQFYNDTAMKYNTRIQIFPGNLFAPLFGFHSIPYFEVLEAAQREAVQVRF